MNNFLSGLFKDLLMLVPAVPAILWAISFHEFCHAGVAYLCGDPCAKYAGRLTLNPLAHFDPWGLLCMFLFHFGWAKPVPVDPRNFRNPRRDIFLVAASGIVGNIASAIIFGFIIRMMIRFFPVSFMGNFGLQQVLLAFVIINLNFAAFNILPLPPLDGSKILFMLLPAKCIPAMEWLERYSLFILLALVYLGVVGHILAPISRWGLMLILG